MAKSAATIRNESLVTAELARSLLDYNPDTGILTWKERKGLTGKRASWNSRNAGKQAGCMGLGGYLVFSINSVLYRAHRVAWLIHYGAWPDDQIDHKDHVRHHNWIGNLRQATNKQNGVNTSKKKNNTSGFNGVSFVSQYEKWQAYIYVDGKKKSLGHFVMIDDAIAARKAANKKYGFHKNHGVHV